MAGRVPGVRVLAVPAVVFVVALGAFAVLDDTTGPAPAGAGATPAELAQRGDLELQRGRETGDPAHQARAEALFRRALAREPRNVDAIIGMGTIAMSDHDFRGALRLARSARRAAPQLARPYAVLVDAQIELGQYPAAGRSLQRMIDLRPNLASYARVSYFRELHGDLDGAAQAMALAVSAGGQVPENVAFVQTLLGDLEFARGRPDSARHAYATALAQRPGHVPARVSRARLDAASGRLDAAIRGYRQVVTSQPLPEYLIALGEAQLADGRERSSRETFARLGPLRRDLAAKRANTEVDVTIFEADHGDRGQAVKLGRQGWREAPSVQSADALGWALTRAGRPDQGLAWARRALKLGWRDPLVLTRAGLSARAVGERATARRYLRRAVERNPRFSVTWAPRAQRALDALR